MNWKLASASLVCLLVTSISANALVTGNDIYPVCEHIMDTPNGKDFKSTNDIMEASMKRGFQIGYCFGVVGSAFQTIRTVGFIWSVDKEFAVCMEKYYGFDEIDGQQMLDMTLKYLKEHPEQRNLTIGTIIATMIYDVFPPTVCGASTFKEKQKKLSGS